MEKTIYKYKVPAGIESVIHMPVGAQVLTIQVQNDEIYLWALVNPNNQEKMYRFRLFGTGWDVPPEYKGKYITTLQDGSFVWHFFQDEEQ